MRVNNLSDSDPFPFPHFDAGILANKLGLTWRTKEGTHKANYFGSITQVGARGRPTLHSQGTRPCEGRAGRMMAHDT